MTFINKLAELYAANNLNAARFLLKSELKQSPLNGLALGELRKLEFIKKASLNELYLYLEIIGIFRQDTRMVLSVIKSKYGKQPQVRQFLKSFTYEEEQELVSTPQGTSGLAAYEQAVGSMDWARASDIIGQLANTYTHDTEVMRAFRFHNWMVLANFEKLIEAGNIFCDVLPEYWGYASMICAIIPAKYPQQFRSKKCKSLTDKVGRLHGIETGTVRDEKILAVITFANQMSAALQEAAIEKG